MEVGLDKFISDHSVFSTDDFFVMLRNDDPDIGRSTVYKILKQLRDRGKIIRTGRGQYAGIGKRIYHYDMTDTAAEISLGIQKVFPFVNFQILELYQMNEFVSHQMAHNTIIIDVENKLGETIFNFLFSKYLHVLYNPSYDEYCKYAGDETIVVKKMISECPLPADKFHGASLEKILVDLFGKGITGFIVPRSEYRSIFEDCFKKYRINTSMMFRYARRRGCEDKIRKFISEETNIVLGN